MSRIYKAAYNPHAGTTFTPRELVQEAREIHGEWNGRLDRENLGSNLITTVKVANNTFMSRYYDATATDQTLEFTHREAVGSQFVPDGNGNPYVIEFETPDCAIVVEASAWVTEDKLSYYLRVDGTIVAFRPWCHTGGLSNDHIGEVTGDGTGVSVWLKGVYECSAGFHVLDWVVGNPSGSEAFAPQTATFKARNISILTLRR